MDSYSEFIEKLIIIHPDISNVRCKIIKYWNPDLPPPTIELGEIGEFIVDNISKIDKKSLYDLFQCIEIAISSDDDLLSTSVATGMIEAIYNRSDQIRKWDLVSKYLGPKSMSHAKSWASF